MTAPTSTGRANRAWCSSVSTAASTASPAAAGSTASRSGPGRNWHSTSAADRGDRRPQPRQPQPRRTADQQRARAEHDEDAHRHRRTGLRAGEQGRDTGGGRDRRDAGEPADHDGKAGQQVLPQRHHAEQHENADGDDRGDRDGCGAGQRGQQAAAASGRREHRRPRRAAGPRVRRRRLPWSARRAARSTRTRAVDAARLSGRSRNRAVTDHSRTPASTAVTRPSGHGGGVPRRPDTAVTGVRSRSSAPREPGRHQGGGRQPARPAPCCSTARHGPASIAAPPKPAWTGPGGTTDGPPASTTTRALRPPSPLVSTIELTSFAFSVTGSSAAGAPDGADRQARLPRSQRRVRTGRPEREGARDLLPRRPGARRAAWRAAPR